MQQKTDLILTDSPLIHSLLHELRLSLHELREISRYMLNGLKSKNHHEVVVDEVEEVIKLQMIVKIKMIQEKKSPLYPPLPKGGSSSQNDKMKPPLLREVPTLRLRMGRRRDLHRNSKMLMNLQKKNELQLCLR